MYIYTFIVIVIYARPGETRPTRRPGRPRLYYTVLYYTILLLYYTILYYTILYYTMLCNDLDPRALAGEAGVRSPESRGFGSAASCSTPAACIHIYIHT